MQNLLNDRFLFIGKKAGINMITMKAVGYEYKHNGILLTVIYDLDGQTKQTSRFYEGATEINFDWEKEAQDIIKRDLDLNTNS